MYLTGVILAVAVVVGIVMQVEGVRSVAEATERTREAVSFRADLAAKDINDALDLTASTVEDLAANPGLVGLFPDGAEGCELAFSGAGPFSAGHIDVVNLRGDVLCSSRTITGTGEYAGAGWLDATATGAIVSQPVADQATGERVLPVVAPIPGLGVVAAFLELDALAPGLSERLSGPVDASFALVAPESGTIPLASDSSEWLEATSPVTALGWDVRAWSPRNAAGIVAAETVADRTRWLLLGATIFLLIFVQLVGAVITRPIRRLSSTVRGHMAGEPPAADVTASGPAEVISLAADFSLLMRTVERERRQREQAEADQAAAEADRESYVTMMNAIMRSTQSLIYVKDLEGRYLMVNASFERAVGKVQADILGKTDMFIAPDMAERWVVADRQARDGIVTGNEFADAPDGRHHFDTVKFPLHDAKGTLYAVCGVSLDVTSRHRMTEAIAEARDVALAATAAKSMFLAAMSHELRTPMTAVIGMTDLLAKTQLTGHQRELVDTVQSSGDALLSVINNILDLSKIESGELHLEQAPFDLRAEIERCLDLVAVTAGAKHLDVVCYVDDSCPATVQGDSTRVRQVVTNLLANAVKFTDSGEVLLEVDAAVSVEDPDAQVVTITVTDTGIGISDASMENLFSSFSQVDASTTRKYGGSGLGLTIARRLAQAMGGDIVVASTPGVGSAFTATMTLAVGDRAEPASAGPDLANLLGRRALIVDDNPTSLRTLGRQLGRLGVDCTLASSALVALRAYDQEPRYDVVLIDMLMPETNGLELGMALHDRQGRLPAPALVLLTSLGLDAADTRGIFAAILAKPVKSAGLHSVLASVLGGDSRAVELASIGPAPHGESRALRVLLAEDHPVNQRVVGLMLRHLGHSVDIVGDGFDAVRAIAARQYDVVLMDLQMPNMDGLEATRRVRAEAGAHQPQIIAMTARALVDDRNACAAAGMDAYLSKPVRAAELDAMLSLTSSRISAAAPTSDPRTVPAITPTPVATAAFDSAALREVLNRLDAGGTGLRDELVNDYLKEGTLLIERLTFAAADGDHVALARAAHALRSPSIILGAATLADLLYGAEHGSSDRTAAEMSPLAEAIVREYGAVADSLRALTSEVPPQRLDVYST